MLFNNFLVCNIKSGLCKDKYASMHVLIGDPIKEIKENKDGSFTVVYESGREKFYPGSGAILPTDSPIELLITQMVAVCNCDVMYE